MFDLTGWNWQCSYNGLTREASHMGISRGVVMEAEYQAGLWRDLLS